MTNTLITAPSDSKFTLNNNNVTIDILVASYDMQDFKNMYIELKKHHYLNRSVKKGMRH